MTSTTGYGWLNVLSGPSSTSFSLFDSSGSELIASGSLCANKNFVCDLALDDGSYVLRVESNLNDMSDGDSWSFCGSSGIAGVELHVTVVNGVCVVDIQLTTKSYLDMELRESKVISILGKFSVSGLSEDSGKSSRALQSKNIISRALSSKRIFSDALSKTLSKAASGASVATDTQSISSFDNIEVSKILTVFFSLFD